jgi:predicted RNA binding protein YcfA (HicA-like mRNA interferase family)
MLKVKQLIRILEKDGWTEVRSKGGHRFFRHPSKKGFIIVPHHGNRDITKGLIIKILKDAGLWEK